MKNGIEFNGHWEKIDNKICFVVDSPTYAAIELEDQIGKGTQGLATKKAFTLRSNEQNRLYWGAIVRQVMKYHKENGEVWTEGEVHEYNLYKVFGIRPTLVVKGSIVFETLQPSVEFLQLKMKERGHDPSILANVKPRSSQFDTIWFSLLVEMCIQHYAEKFGYELKLKVDETATKVDRNKLRISKKSS